MQIGDVLNQRYTLTARLGSGGMAEVFQATDSQTNQMVAVKVLDRPAKREHRANSLIPCHPGGVRASAGSTICRR
jgi:serine/threonine protein kinase